MENTKELEKKNHSKTLDIAYIAIGAALISICAWISIPMTIPFTLQTFAVFAVVMTLGGKRGTLSTIVYILLGLVGAPVFSGFNAGVGVLLGNTGGYILGFVFIGLIYMLATKIFGEKLAVEIAALVLGLIVCYAFGTAWFMFNYLRKTGSVGLVTVLSWCVFPYILPDLVKLALAVLLSKRIKPAIK